MIDAEGQHEPVRVTHTEGFDGLPVFTPDGKRMAWTTNRTAKKQSQIFWADWDHTAAMKLLDLDESYTDAADLAAAAKSLEGVVPDYSKQDILRHVDYLCREELAGRMTGTQGEKLATAYVAAAFDSFGLQPAGPQGKWFQSFDFTAGVDLGEDNRLQAGLASLKLNRQWRPLAFAANGKIAEAPVVFGGYGIVAPAGDDQEEYDSYVHLDVKDKWVVCFRFLPGGHFGRATPAPGSLRKHTIQDDAGPRPWSSRLDSCQRPSLQSSRAARETAIRWLALRI